jgi:hypothetical protein
MKKTCREFQFRIKQLQEQCTYLEKKKTKEIQIPLQTPATLDDNNNVQDTANSQIVKADTSALSPNSSASSIHIPDAALHPESDAPSWMRD